MGLKLNLKDISTDEVLQDELKEKGGKTQTPYLVDDETGIAMYESNAIAAYLHEHYGQGTNVTMNGPAECESCQ